MRDVPLAVHDRSKFGTHSIELGIQSTSSAWAKLGTPLIPYLFQTYKMSYKFAGIYINYYLRTHYDIL
jgi:hypothetical protein